MEQARIVIIGAGPAGLVLALSLSQQNISSIVLEKETQITLDPRGVFLAGDANRILWSLGLGPQMPRIGHEVDKVHFHSSSFVDEPWFSLDVKRDALQQTVPSGVFMVQPELEKALREKVNQSELCDLRVGCEVRSLREGDGGTGVEYIDSQGSSKRIQTTWLVGADGKKGVVRKTFLEPLADIRQVQPDYYRYEGTWVAANLKISLPTPETHPDFPPWKVGMNPEEVYDLFWPKDWHFVSPPGKPTASGRFGPLESRLWRHEFRQEDYDDSTMDAEELLWEHLNPMITRKANEKGIKFPEEVMFPRDCIEVLRCRPFAFAHKVVNKWHYKRNVLIGDAAHVFPPFGGQGIASGIRDAHQLAWRIAALERNPRSSDALTDKILNAWSIERAKSIKHAAGFTKMNGFLCNNPKPLMFPVVQAMEKFSEIMFGPTQDKETAMEKKGFHGMVGGFYLNENGGGGRLPQIYVDTLFERQVLSDSIFDANDSPLRLLVLHHGNKSPETSIDDVKRILSDHGIPPEFLSPNSIVALSTIPCKPESIGSFTSPGTRKVCPTPLSDLHKSQTRKGYDVNTFATRLGKETKYVIVRPDFYVFATAGDLWELRACFERLGKMVGEEDVKASL